MEKKIYYCVNEEVVERKVNYIPVRYIISIILAVLEVAAIVGIVAALCYYVPYFYILAWMTEIACVVMIIASDDNPDYKIPWILVVLLIPIAGFMLYFLFYSRKLKKKYTRRLKELKEHTYCKDDSVILKKFEEEDPRICSQAKMLCKIAETHVFTNTKQTYFEIGEDMYQSILEDLEKAEKFIFAEYFIVEEGLFWNSMLEIMKRKAATGVQVKLVYDDIGCMMTLPGDYFKMLRKSGIEAVPFSILRGNADSEFNNRSHRKILVIDGKVGYTGGVNIADEYINEIEKFGHWKDTGIRLEGEAVWELTKLFLIDFGINVKKMPKIDGECFPTQPEIREEGYLIPFGDGPAPIYKHRVGKIVLQSMLANATRYVYMTSPYLIIDNELCQSIENAAIRGVDVRIIVPHIPDKKIILDMTRSFYPRLIEAGVRIYEYEPGFIHAKSYLADDECGMIGTINLDYRSLVHHFENGVWMYKCKAIPELKKDILDTMDKSIEIRAENMKSSFLKKSICSVLRVLAPML